MKRISEQQAKNYYTILKNKIEERGGSVLTIKDKNYNYNYYGNYILEDFRIEISNNRSEFLSLIILAHEFGHFIGCIDYFKNYGKRAYNKYIKKIRCSKTETILSEAEAWINAEKELCKIDRNICLDYRFHKHRKYIFEGMIKEAYQTT